MDVLTCKLVFKYDLRNVVYYSIICLLSVHLEQIG